VLSNDSLPDYHMTAACGGGKMVAVGGGFAVSCDLTTGAITALASTGDQSIVEGNSPGFVFHPPSGKFVGWNGGANLYQLDPATWAWTVFPIGGVVPTAPAVNGTFGRFRYDPGLDCFVVVNDISQPVFQVTEPFSGGSSAAPPPAPAPANSVAVKDATSGITTTFSTLQAAQPSINAGATVTISGGEFTDGLAITAANVTVNVEGGVSFVGGTVDGGVGCFDIKGANCVMTALGPVNISRIHGDGTACGIRHTAGDLDLEGPWTISDCDNGVMSSPGAGNTLIGPLVTLSGCGQNVDQESPGHNAYLQGASTTFRGTSLNAVFGGHELKVRSPVCTVGGAHLEGSSGDNSRLFDYSNGGALLFMSNTLIQGPDTENAEMIGICLEGVVDGRQQSSRISGNTVTTTRPTSVLVETASPTLVTLQNNSVTAAGSFSWSSGSGAVTSSDDTVKTS
jgi:hypothetical protein